MCPSVTASNARTPVLDAIAVRTAPQVQMPEGLDAVALRHGERVPPGLRRPSAGSSRAVSGSQPWCWRAGAGSGSPG